MQADAFLFETLVGDGRHRRRREADLRPHAAEPAQAAAPTSTWSTSSPTASTSTRCAALLRRRCSRSSPTSSRTSRTRPATRCRARSARRCSRSPREYGFTIFEDDPYVALRFSGEALPTMLSLDEHGSVVYASSFSKTVCPGIRVGYLVGPAELIAAITRAGDEHVHLAEHGRPGASSTSSARAGAIDALDRDRQDRARRARRRRSPRRSSASSRRRASCAPEGGYFLWVELPEGTDVAALFARRGRARRADRQGHRLPARGRREHAAPRVLGRHARRRSTRASRARRGLPLARSGGARRRPRAFVRFVCAPPPLVIS